MRPLLSAVVLRSQTDERLVALARDGHEQAFVAIAQRYRRELMAHARRVAPADRAEDVVQHAMLSAWSALTRRADVLEVRAWLHRIVHNAALRVAQRGDQHDELTEALAARSRTDATVELRFDARDALTALAGLPDTERRALELTALGGSSGRDAAAELGVSEGALRKLVHRARSTLRSGVAALIPQPLLTWSLGGHGSPVAAHVAQLSAGAGFSAAVTKVGVTVAVTASLVGGASQLLPGLHRHHLRPHATPVVAAGVAERHVGEASGVASRSHGASASNAARTPHRGRAGSGSQRGQSGSNVGERGGGQQGTASQRGAANPPAGSDAERPAGGPSLVGDLPAPAAATEPSNGTTPQTGVEGPMGGQGAAGGHQPGGQDASHEPGPNQP